MAAQGQPLGFIGGATSGHHHHVDALNKDLLGSLNANLARNMQANLHVIGAVSYFLITHFVIKGCSLWLLLVQQLSIWVTDSLNIIIGSKGTICVFIINKL